MDGGKYLTKVTSGASRSEDGKSIRFAMTSDDPAVDSAGYQADRRQPAGERSERRSKSQLAHTSDYFNAGQRCDYAASEADAAGWKTTRHPNSAKRTTTTKADRSFRIGVESVMGISGIGNRSDCCWRSGSSKPY